MRFKNNISAFDNRWRGGLGGGSCVLGEFRSQLSGTAADHRRGPGPSHAQGGRGEGRIVVLEGDRAENLTVSQRFRGRPWGVILAFVVRILLVPAHCIPWEGFWKPVLQQFAEGHIPVQCCLAAQHSQRLDMTHLTVKRCVKHF